MTTRAPQDALSTLPTATLYAEVRALELDAISGDYYVRLIAQCQLDARLRELVRRGEDC